MKLKLLIVLLLSALSFDAAAAQTKRDIRGIYPGMTGAQALAEFKKMDCRLLAAADYTFSPVCIYRNGDFYKNQDLHAFLASNLSDTPVWAVVMTFSSILSREQISDAVARQFRVRMGPNDIAQPDDERTRVDLGGGLWLRLAPEQGPFIDGYRLSVWSADLKAQEDRAELAMATPKF